jgi:aldehyde reductase
MYTSVDKANTWRAMEKCVELGLTRSIGLSNFNSKQLQHVLANSTIKPVIHQVPTTLVFVYFYEMLLLKMQLVH